MDWEQIQDKLSGFGESVGGGLKNFFGSRNERAVRELGPLAKKISALEEWAQGLSADEMKAKTSEFKEAVAKGEKTLDDLLPEAFAMVREASVRTLGLRHFDVQMVGGIVLHQGKIAEMMTGEGKTLVATLPLYLNALAGEPVYLVTVNDYLARRDGDWMRPIYEYLGLTIGSIQSTMDPGARHPVYACDIVYGTNNEFGFDYLRDNMKTSVDQQVQRTLAYAIVDEVDSILIDEARTPLIISGPAELGTENYLKADEIARKLKAEEHYEVKEKERSASLLEDGIVAAQEMVGVESFYTSGNEEWPHFIENSLRAHNLYTRDKEYVVEQGEIIIVDEFTGRKMNGRRWSDGLHQAVEVKEGLKPARENQTLATITFQNYFRMFGKLAGMTGTALTEAGEFHKIYDLDVMSVPTNLPVAREDFNDTIYRTEPEKWKAIVEEIGMLHERGQPVLVGTTSVEKSETLAKLLRQSKIPHEVLNAKHHEREAQIVALAGARGAVTVATNMAGRGTDIKLGGNFEYRLGQALEEKGLVLGDEAHLAEIDQVREALQAQCERDESEVLGLGGLYVMGTERHEARRIDNQLRGRSGRQGNAGTSRFFLSLQDDLMRIFYRDWVTKWMEKLGMTEGQAIEAPMVSRAIEKAQKKVEDRNFEIRKSLLEYDEVMDQQRKTVYTTRQEVLEGIDTKVKVLDMLEGCVRRAADTFFEDREGFQGWFHRTFGIDCPSSAAEAATSKGAGIDQALDAVEKFYDEREEEVGPELMRKVESFLLLNSVDGRWKDHLRAMDALKAGIGLRGYGQIDPKTEYKREGFELFQRLFEVIEDEVASLVLRFRVRGQEDGEGEATLAPRGMGPGGQASHAQPLTEAETAKRRAMQAQAQRAQQVRQAARAQVPASHAFDAAKRQQAIAEAQRAKSTSAGEEQPQEAAVVQTPEKEYAGTGRNDSCPCGSGKKYKKCHGR